MEPYTKDASIVVLLVMARDWIKQAAQKHQEEQTAMANAKEVARNEAIVMPELSRADCNMVLKVFKSNTPGCERSEWYIAFKRSFEEMSAIRKQAQDARTEQARLRGEERKARLEAEQAALMGEILTPWGSASSSVGPSGASTAEPANSSGPTKEKRGVLLPQTPQRTPKCYICERKAHEHSVCAFCERVCCDRHRRNTVCCQYWKCDQDRKSVV